MKVTKIVIAPNNPIQKRIRDFFVELEQKKRDNIAKIRANSKVKTID